MKCRFCNSDIESDALFCPYCGKDLSKSDKCVNCGKTIENDMVFCPHCGTKQPRESPATQANEDFSTIEIKECICCGESIEADSIFCPFCGKSQSMEKTTNEEQEIIQDIKKPQEDVARIIQDENISVSEPPKNDLADTLEPYESERSSKKWLWILGVILLLCMIGGGWYYFKGEHFGSEAIAPIEEEVDSIAELKDSLGYDLHSIEGVKERLNEILTSALRMDDEEAVNTYFTQDFRELFRKVSDYDDTHDFEGPGYFIGNLWDGGQNGNPNGFKINVIDNLTYTSADAFVKFLYNTGNYHSSTPVSVPLVFENGNWYIDDINGNKEGMKDYLNAENAEDNISSDSNDVNGTITMAGKVSEYAIHMVLLVIGADVDGYYFYDSQGSDNKVILKGVINDGRIKLVKKDKDGNETGYFEGHFDGTIYQGDNVNYSRDEKLPFTVEKVNNE